MNCPTCGHHITGKFCSNCGEKKFDRNELTLMHFFSEALESFAHFDNKFLRTVKSLLFRPGQLDVDFMEGRRVRFMKAIQLFLVVNLIFFFLLPSNPFALDLSNYLTYRPFTDYNTEKAVQEKLAEDHITLPEYRQVFNEKMKTESKEFIFVYIPFYAGILALLLGFYRRTFVEHLMFSAHFITFYMIYSFLLFYIVTVPFYLIVRVNYSEPFDTVTTIGTSLAIFGYLWLAMNRFYRGSRLWNFIVAGSIGGTFFFLIQYYRMFLFFKIVRWH